MNRKLLSLLLVVSVGWLHLSVVAEEAQRLAERPNILWLTCEDSNVEWFGCYGNPEANTPNIDQLAREGFQYLHAYANAPVCAPSRSTWITGVHALSMGTHPMRSRYEIPHDRIPYYPDALRASGYYTGNFNKTDYNIGGREDRQCWDNARSVDWDTLKQNQPFFQIINSKTSHESRAQGTVENTIHDPADTRLRAYHPDLPLIRKNYAKYHDAVTRMDAEIGASLQKLEAMGLAENTIVIFNSDHGGVLPRSKRYLFESGLHCPLIVRIPEGLKHLWPADQPGTTVDRLVSFIDMPKTWLSLTGASVPEVMQGKVFLGPAAEAEQRYHFAYRARMDERLENARAVSDQRYLYIRNYMPYVPWMQRLNFLWKMKATVAWEAHVKAGQATEVQARFFAPKGWTEELYDLEQDPDNVNNLIDSPELKTVVSNMRVALHEWQLEVHDAGMLPESEAVKRAADHNMTIYEMVRDPELYDLPALLNAADLALEQNSANLSALHQLLEHADSGLRYWGMVGCFLLDDASVATQGMQDDSDEVRAMAAWLAIRSGDSEAGLDCLNQMIADDSYAMLAILNVIDWADTLVPQLPEALLTAKVDSYPERMRDSLFMKYGLPIPAKVD